MNYFFSFLLIPLSILLLTQNANALLVAETPLEIYYHNELIVLGKVISLKEDSNNFSIQYDVKIDEYVKNKKLQDLITVFGTENTIPSPPKFEMGDKALLLLNKAKDGRYEISPLSFKAKAGCDVHQLLGMQVFPDEPMPRGIPYDKFEVDKNCIGINVSVPSGLWVFSPLQQLKSGVTYSNVQCSNGLELVYKKSGNTSACVTMNTKIELTVRGWAEDDRVLGGLYRTRGCMLLQRHGCVSP